MRKTLLCVVLLVAATAALSIPAAAGAKGAARPTQFVVLYQHGASLKAAHAAIRAAGGRVVRGNRAIGLATVAARGSRFIARARAQRAIAGAAADRVIGRAPGAGHGKPPWRDVESDGDGRRGRDKPPPVANGDRLSGLQWDMQMIGATPSGSYARQQGSHDVRVGIIDTGVDGSHPDIAPNFDRALSPNFTVDNPVPGIDDGPCEHPSCVDPADEDDDGHGTHVAGTVGGALNGLGVAGVAPRVDLVNIRAGQDSGFFLLQPTVDALTYAGDHGIDVVNMSFFIDPWLFNCTANPADSPEQQAEQRTIIIAMQRALDYAYANGGTLVSAAGNAAEDYTKTLVDAKSPDFAGVPGEAPHARTIPTECISMPSEG